MNRTLAVLLTAIFSSALHAAPELKGSPDELSHYLLEQRKIVTLSGSATEEVEADTAIVAISVRTKEPKLNEALQENEKARQLIKENLQQAGIAADKIKSSKFSSTPNYGWFGDKPSSYEISNEVKITIGNEAQLRAIAKIVDGRKDVLMGGTEFKDSQKESNEQKVLQKALESVKAKQTTYEKSLGVTLTPVRVIDQQVYTRSAPRIRPQARSLMKEGDMAAAMVMSEPMMEEAPSGDFGAITYSANTAVEFVVGRDSR